MVGITAAQSGFILQGTGWTIVLSLLGFAGGAVFGLPLALLLARRRSFLRALTALAVNLVQGIPLPILMFAVYFGTGISGYDPPALLAAACAIAVYSAVFLAEIWKGALQAVPRTQREAADCLALSAFDATRLVIIPQAVRIATPPTIGFFVQVVKNTSFAVVLAVTELTYSARIVNNASNQPFLIFTIAGVIYFIICFPLSVLSRRLETAIGRSRKRAA